MGSHRLAAIYMRVSTDFQSVDSQRQDLIRFAQNRGLSIQAEYCDRGISGSKESRPQLNVMMADARRRKFDVVVVWSFSRFSRTLKQLVLCMEEFQALGIDFISFSESVDTSTPSGRVLFAVIAAFSQFEREITRERVMAGLRAAKARGKRLGRPTRIDNARVRDLRNSGHSLSSIASMIGATKSGVSKSLRKMSLGLTHGNQG